MFTLALAAAVSANPSRPSWTAPMAPVHIVGNTWDIGSRGLAMFLIKTSKGLIVIDAGMPGWAPEIVRSIRAAGFDPRDVKWILNTHAHLDHAGGIAELARLTGAKVAAMTGDVPSLSSGTYPGDEQDKSLDFPPVKVDRMLKDGDRIVLGDTALTATLTAGHSPGCTTWSWDQKAAGKTLHVVENCSMTIALNRLVGRPSYPGIIGDYRRSFAKLERMKADVFLAPHTERFGFDQKLAHIKPGSANPFVDPGEIARRVAQGRAEFDAGLAKQEADPPK